MLKAKKAPENKVPPILKATRNVVLADLKNYQIKEGDVINLYSKFPAGIVRRSMSVKHALSAKILIEAVGKNNSL